MVTRQLQIERGTGKVRRSETGVLPLCHAARHCCWCGPDLRLRAFALQLETRSRVRFTTRCTRTARNSGPTAVRCVRVKMAATHARRCVLKNFDDRRQLTVVTPSWWPSRAAAAANGSARTPTASSDRTTIFVSATDVFCRRIFIVTVADRVKVRLHRMRCVTLRCGVLRYAAKTTQHAARCKVIK